jgi:peptide deformylase
MIRRILTLPRDKRALRTICDLVTTEDMPDLATDLVDTMIASTRPALGLAAPQIGVSLRVFVVRHGGVFLSFVNPVITAKSILTEVAEEGCLSLPGCRARIRRFVAITLTDALHTELKATGQLARVIQHELDHLDGILITDREAELAWERKGRAG